MLAMKYKAFFIAVSALVLFAAIAGAQPAPSWTQNDAYMAWEGYKSYFYNPGAGGGYVISDVKGGNTWTSMWQQAEQIEVAEDAYYWSKRIPGSDPTPYLDHVNNLCQGFIDNMTPRFVNPHDSLDWSADLFNDDLMWASIAFARAYQITGKTEWLTAAEKQFNTVWGRAQAGNNGLIQSNPPTTPPPEGWTPVEDAPVNFTFVIAGYLLYDNTGVESYKDDADQVYGWASQHLFAFAEAGPQCNTPANLICVKIYDADNTDIPKYGYHGKIGASDFTYNYGTAIQAAVREAVANTNNDQGTNAVAAQNIANYLMFNLDNTNSPYALPPYDGYNILPDYTQPSGSEGYNGIALRGVGLGLDRNVGGQPILNGTTLAWAQANLQSAWNFRNTDTNVIWNDWVAFPPSGTTLYSWNCSNAVAGMLDIAPPN